MRARMDVTSLPVALRAALGLAMVLGLLTMCHATFSIATSTDTSPDPRASSASSVLMADDESAVSGAVAPQASDPDDIGGECALLVTCTIALAAVGALLMLRARRVGRVLWQQASSIRRADGVAPCVPLLAVVTREPAALRC